MSSVDKICPIMSRYIWEGANNQETGLHDVKCFKSQCAWWDEEREKCAVLGIAKVLTNMNESGLRICSTFR